MERVIYCPSDEHRAEAEKLSSDWHLPMQIGDSEATRNLAFDRDVVQVVEIPTLQNLYVSHTIFRAGKNLRVEYLDEFDDVSGVLLKLTFSNGSTKVIKPETVYDGTNAVFGYRPQIVGKLKGEIIDAEGVLAEFDCEVRP